MKEEFQDIAPYDDCEFQEKMAGLVKEPLLKNAINYIMPGADYDSLVDTLLAIKTKDEFQAKIIGHVLQILEKNTTSGVTDSGFENYEPATGALFITNHRDIVLDASFLGLSMLRHGHKVPHVALGDNLLIQSWIEDLMRLNKGIIVKRNLRLTKALEAAKQLSSFIHWCIADTHQCVWIAQREGRAKDSNDVTQESVIKMFALSGPGESIIDKLTDLNITPIAISYEFDPNDYLKAREFLARRRDPEFKKSQRDDLYSMEVGILSFKGRVHYQMCTNINPQLHAIADPDNKVEAVRQVCAIIDREIHLGYRIYPINYIAFDRVNHTSRFASLYTDEDVAKFDSYLEGQLDKVDLPDITAEERDFMRNFIMAMYSNPLRNQLIAKGETL